MVVLEPTVVRLRAERGLAFEENFEWLAGVMADFSRRRGGAAVDEAFVEANLEALIDGIAIACGSR